MKNKLVCYKCGLKRGYKKVKDWPPFMTTPFGVCPDCKKKKILVPERYWNEK